jgi:lysophospholipase L1-like esterase
MGFEVFEGPEIDTDYYCFGFSGNCKGDLPIADFFNTLDFSIFVYDYDHNAPTVEHLKATHEPFYKAIRKANPSTPIIMMTRPRPYLTDDEAQRRMVVKTTYENAIKNGDKNVYFIDGTSFFDGNDSELCFVDALHPNDLGFFKMATRIEPLIKSLLEE